MPEFNFHVSPNGYLLRLEPTSSGPVDIHGGTERYPINWAQFDVLMGRMLTIVDASFSDTEQRDAVKSLVRNSIRDWAQEIVETGRADERKPVSSENGTTSSINFAAGPTKAAA